MAKQVRPKIFTHLWYAKEAEQAAAYYASIFPDSRVDRVWALQAESPSGPPGSVKVVDFLLEIWDAGDEFKLRFDLTRYSLGLTAGLIDMHVPEVDHDAYAVIRYALESIVRFRSWDEDFAVPWGKTRISLYIGHSVAEVLAVRTGLTFDRSGGGHMLLVSREVA